MKFKYILLERRSLTISCILVAGTLRAVASALTLMPIDIKKSSLNISPGCRVDCF